jgi:3-deoxy-7-phosphoheptulonate synthase
MKTARQGGFFNFKISVRIKMSPEVLSSSAAAFFEESRKLKDKLVVKEDKRRQAAYEATRNDAEKAPVRQHEIIHDEIASPNLLSRLIDTRIEDQKTRISAELLIDELPLTTKMALTTLESRMDVEKILMGEDGRIFVIVGPCSIHDPVAAIKFAEQVEEWREEFGDELEIIMRFYTEKPRTELKEDPLASWKGLAYDPLRDGSNDINLGMISARRLARHITNIGVPLAAERLDPVTPQYMDGLITYDAIGARDTTSQNARHYGSGTSSVIGFKNTPEGSIDAAIEAAASARVKSTFSGSHKSGAPSEQWTTGNPTSHIIHRGHQENGTYVTNFSPSSIASSKEKLRAKGLAEVVVVDVSHANSHKNASRQIEGVKEISRQVSLGETAIKGVMIESNLVAGKQDIVKARDEGRELVFGQSITDECAGLDETYKMLTLLARAVRARKKLSVAKI